MNYYQEIIRKIEDNKYLVSMVPVDEIVRFGYESGLNETSKVLDLCCGYGTVLKVLYQAFGISGVGIDLSGYAIEIGQKRLKEAGADNKIKLIYEDVTKYADNEKYDAVICSETIDSIENTVALGEKFLKSGGILAYQKVYSKIPNPPQELLDFEGEVLPLSELNRIFNGLGYYITSMASDTNAMWERYIFNSHYGESDFDELKANPGDEERKKWFEKWRYMYFEYRRPYQGQALFGLKKL